MMGQPIRKTPIEEILYRPRTGPPRRLESEDPLWMRPGRDTLALPITLIHRSATAIPKSQRLLLPLPSPSITCSPTPRLGLPRAGRWKTSRDSQQCGAGVLGVGMEHSLGETCREKDQPMGFLGERRGAIVTTGTALERLLSFGCYDQEAARTRLRRGVPYVHQLRGQPLAQCPIVRIPLRVQARAFGDHRDHRRPPFLGSAAQVAKRP